MGFFDRKKQQPAQPPVAPPTQPPVAPPAQPPAVPRTGVPSFDEMAAMAQQAQGAARGGQYGDMMAMAKQMQAGAMTQMAEIEQATAGTEAGSMTWARQVLKVLVPPQPGFVKRCSCHECGAPKKLAATTAYVYCDYCGSLVDYDLRLAAEGDAPIPLEYPQLVNGLHPKMKAAQAAGDRDSYRAMQRQSFEAFVKYQPNAVSHRARNDETYREQYITYMAESATAKAFDPAAARLEEELRQAAIGLRYTGPMMTQKVEPVSFWPMVDAQARMIEAASAVNRSSGAVDLDPDRAEHIAPKMGWSLFCQGWLPMLPEDAAAQLLDRCGLKNDYVAVQPEGGVDRKCGGCGGAFLALPDAKAVVCDQCGRKLDVGSAEIPCRNCGGSMTFPLGAESTTCPFCHVEVDRVGLI